MDKVEMNIHADIMNNPTVVGDVSAPIIINNCPEAVQKVGVSYENFQLWLKAIEDSRKKAGNEQKLLMAIQSLENAIMAENKSDIKSTAKELIKNFAEGILQGVMGSALFEAVKAWAFM